MKTHWKCFPTAGFGSELLFAAFLFLIYPNHVGAQQQNQEPPAAIGGRGVPTNPIPLMRIQMGAEQGQVAAQCHMGSVYADGREAKQ
jgi:hypothetical protein